LAESGINRPLVAAVGAYATGLLLAHWFHPPLAGLLIVLVLVCSRMPKRESRLAATQMCLLVKERATTTRTFLQKKRVPVGTLFKEGAK
jgi:hypothetical protein